MQSLDEWFEHLKQYGHDRPARGFRTATIRQQACRRKFGAGFGRTQRGKISDRQAVECEASKRAADAAFKRAAFTGIIEGLSGSADFSASA